ncbi:MAG TPA: hypothetical protein VFV96_05515 [Verrucomicrobiae bacterium]|nr:hypothetical protein [Verrucomicrobiae bacterium]
MEQKYTVELVGPGLSLKKELPEPVAHELLVWLLKGGRLQAQGAAITPQPTQAEVKVSAAPQPAGHTASAVVSVREFMEQYSPARVPDKIACFGLYLREHRNQREFAKEDLVGLFQDAADPLPKNLTRDIRWTQQIAWVAPSATNPEMYYLTKKGEDAVRAKFAKELVQKTRFSAPARRRNGAPDDKSDTATESSPDAT